MLIALFLKKYIVPFFFWVQKCVTLCQVYVVKPQSDEDSLKLSKYITECESFLSPQRIIDIEELYTLLKITLLICLGSIKNKINRTNHVKDEVPQRDKN